MTPQEWLSQIHDPNNTKHTTRDMAAKAEKIIAAQLAENASLKAFATELLADFPKYNSIDAEAAQKLAVKHGLKVAVERSAPCHGGHQEFYCACYEAGLFDQTNGTVTCYKNTNILRSEV